MCRLHYDRYWRSRDFVKVYVSTSAIDRLWRKVNKNGPIPECRPDLGQCWLWTGALSSDGYGTIRDVGLNGSTLSTHILSYEASVGPVAVGLELDHLCRVRHCVRPTHLEAVTPEENMRRGVSPFALKARQTHCLRGHLFDEENTYVTASGRHCKKCKYLTNAEGRERRRAAAGGDKSVL